MTRKQFLILVLALVVLGGAGLALFWQDITDYRASGAKIGAKLLPSLKVADVAQIQLRDAKSRVTLIRKENSWVVQERSGYPPISKRSAISSSSSRTSKSSSPR